MGKFKSLEYKFSCWIDKNISLCCVCKCSCVADDIERFILGKIYCKIVNIDDGLTMFYGVVYNQFLSVGYGFIHTVP